jgi:predicted lipid carrier protein YhbT
MDAARRALAGHVGLKQATVEVTLTLEQAVTGGPDGPVRWHVRLDHGAVDLVEGPAPHADLRFTASYGTAAGIASGAVAAQRAFAEGRLRVGGDVSLLVAHHRTLAALDDALADLRSRTSFASDGAAT